MGVHDNIFNALDLVFGLYWECLIFAFVIDTMCHYCSLLSGERCPSDHG